LFFKSLCELCDFARDSFHAKIAIYDKFFSSPIGRTTLNVLPTPSSLSTDIVPCNFSTSFLEIDKPKPVPSNLRVIVESTCLNGLKSLSKSFLSIPIPVSITLVTIVSSIISHSTFTKPISVNLIELFIKLRKICSTLLPSLIISLMFGEILNCNFKLFFSASD
jgi:hypothetical protein